LLEVKNRGDYINVDLDYFPKTLETIEYFDIYPEYE
jgi:hypothetical protein